MFKIRILKNGAIFKGRDETINFYSFSDLVFTFITITAPVYVIKS
jgi:hypothetical protein